MVIVHGTHSQTGLAWDGRGAMAPRPTRDMSGHELADGARVGAGELAGRVGLQAADAHDPFDVGRAGGLLVLIGKGDDGLLVRRQVRLARLLALGNRLLVGLQTCWVASWTESVIGSDFDWVGTMASSAVCLQISFA